MVGILEFAAGLSRNRLLHGGVLALGVVLPLLATDFGMFIAAVIIVNCLFAIAYDLLYGYTGLLSFGHAMFFGWGAYAAALMVLRVGTGLFTALIVAFLVSTVIVVLVGVTLRVSQEIHAFVIISILVALVLELVARTWTSFTGGTDGYSVSFPPITIPGLGQLDPSNPYVRYYLVFAVFFVSFVFLYRLVNSPIGLAFKLIRENEQKARALGYNTSGYKFLALLVSGMFSGLAGALDMYVNGYVSAADFNILVSADPVLFTLIGGRGTIIGPAIGAVVVTGASEQFQAFTNVYQLLIGALLVIVAVREPDGIMAIIRRHAPDRWGLGGEKLDVTMDNFETTENPNDGQD